MEESDQPEFISLGHEPLVTPATEKSFTLSPTTERGDPLTPVFEKPSFDIFLNEVPVHGSPDSIASTIEVAAAADGFVLDAPDDSALGHGTSTHGISAVKASHQEIHTTNSNASRPTAKGLVDRQNRLMAELLTRFTNLVKLATAPEEAGATLETQAALSLQMEIETTALVKAIEDLHRLTRDLKELWLAGPLRGIGESEGDGDMANNATEVQKLVNDITKRAQELNGRNDVQCK